MEMPAKRIKLVTNPTQVVVFSFALVILTGAFILMLPAATVSGRISFIDALFTATSAVCVTGLVVVDTGTYFTPFGQLAILALIQIGGLGFMTLATLFFIMTGRKIGLRNRLIMQEALNQFTLAGVIRLTKYIIIMTLAIEGLGAVMLGARLALDYGPALGIYFGVFHAVSAFCNAGFDLIGGFRNFTGYVGDVTVNLTLTSLLILGGLGFSVITEAVQKRSWRQLSLHAKLVLTITALLLATGTAVFLLLEHNNPLTMGPLPWPVKLLASYFQAATPRTAGFNTINIGGMTTAGLFFTIILMFIGASPASTGGGVKTTTFGVLLLTVLSVVRNREDVDAFQKRVAEEVIYKALAITLISLALVVTVTMLLSFTEAHHASFLQVLFETVSAFGTVGLTAGITTELTGMGRLLIILTMYSGRVGPLSLFIALTQQQRPASFHYPEDKIMVG